MELCRSKFAKEAKQQFNQTIVEEDDEAAAAPSTWAPPPHRSLVEGQRQRTLRGTWP